MEFLLFVFAVFTFGIAWRARNAARQAHQQIRDLRAELGTLRARLDATPAPGAAREETIAPPVAAPVPAAPSPHYTYPDEAWRTPPQQTVLVVPVTPAAAPAVPLPLAAESRTPDLATPAEEAAPAAASETTTPPRPPAPTPQWLLNAKAWLFGGNLVAKLGLLILFIGVSFLLKYTAARVSVPIEFRLAGIVLADIALLAWGWRIRLSRPAISLPVQGAALAVLMLVTFGAFRIYHLIPGSMAFGLLFVLTVFTCLLAVLQDAMWLAIFGIAGGFAAPILASTGGGSHIGLFSYYALLNAGVFALALLRSWRPLNLLGFAFTFTISTAWGVLRYVPENYLSVQLFLLLFFAFYVSIPLAYARLQAVKLKNYVDGTLIFGTPMLGFGLQFTLVRDMPFGAAYSALALGLFYISLATALRRKPQYTLLSDAFLALGVVFGTLAIPFALDGRWTSAAWALEGAGIVWIGLRQKQKLAWMFGLLVQAGAWLSFIGASTGMTPENAMNSNLWLGFLLLAITAFLMATRFRAQQDGSHYRLLSSIFLIGATVWLVAGAWAEILLRLSPQTQSTPLAFSAMIAVAALYVIARRMLWPLAGAVALVVQAVAGLKLLELFITQPSSASANLLQRPLLGSLIIVAAAFFSSWVLKKQSPARGTRLYSVYRITLTCAALWWFCIAASDLTAWLVALTHSTPFDSPFLAFCIYSILLAATTVASVHAARRLHWPGLRWMVTPVWAALLSANIAMLAALYTDGSSMPDLVAWIGYAVLWVPGNWLLRVWQREGWNMRGILLRALHALRIGGPWLMIWPVGAYWITRWLGDVPGNADWTTSASWARFVPSWLMMAAVAWLMQRSLRGGWPAAPLEDWYQRRLLPVARGWAVLLVFVWNLTQDGAMLPLPYVPLLNPLDLSTCFAILLLAAAYRLHPAALPPNWPPRWIAPQPLFIALFGYFWFNLALLRTVSHYLGVPYNFDALFASQFVQAMLSLVWSVTALLLMRHAARRTLRPVWIAGATLLALVVAKLFLVDLSNVGGVERIVSFLGVGALMVGIGYLAPFPAQQTENA